MKRTYSTPAADMEDEYRSTGLWEGLSRQFGSFLGIFIIFAIAMAAASLASWNFADPSLNNYAAETAPTNVLGFWGASFADIFMQFFGLGSVAVLLPPFFRGLLLIAQKNTPRKKSRLLFWAIGILVLSAACALLPVPQNWPMPIGLGGVVGDKLVDLFHLNTAGSSFTAFTLAAVILFPLSLLCAAYAGGVIFRETGAVRQAGAEQHHAYASASYSEAHPGISHKNTGAVIARIPGATDELDEDGESGRFDTLRNITGLIQHIFLSCTAFGRRAFGRKYHTHLHGGFAADTITERTEPYIEVHAEKESSHSFAAHHSTPATAHAAENTPRRSRFFDALAGKTEKTHSHSAYDHFALPSLSYLARPKKLPHNETKIRNLLQNNAQRLAGVLEDFGIKGDIVQAYPGPVVTLYELEPAPGVKSSRIISLADDIARSMSASSARIAIIPKRNALGIELPNQQRETVFLREMLESRSYCDNHAKLALALGQSIGGDPVIADLAKMPHLLVAGTTGSGKSVAINTMILSLLYRLTPQECRLIMVDPKMLELSVYDGIPHLLTPVVTDPKKALSALKWAVREMEERYGKMAKLGVRNIDGFNARVKEARKPGEKNLSRTVQTGFDKETGRPVFETEELIFETLPYIVVIIDEMADLMMVAGKEIEGAVQRLAQMARAAGIHVIMATQRPSVDVITGTIKANFPTRISFQVTGKIDSRTILGEQGAEQLLGQGDMLYMAGGGRIKRVHGPFVGDLEVEKVVSHLKKQGTPEYLSAVMECNDDDDETAASGGGAMQASNDPYDKAVDIVLRDRKASTSYIQRRLGIGYNRAASIIERMEEEGVISAANHAGKREILVPERKAS